MDSADTNQQGVSVQVRGLRKSFFGQEVLKGLDFEVKRVNLVRNEKAGYAAVRLSRSRAGPAAA